MSFDTHFFGLLSGEGRLKQQWTEVLMESDLTKGLISLRQVLQQLHSNPKKFAYRWKPFLDVFFSAEYIHILTEKDLSDVEHMADLLVRQSTNACVPEEIWLQVIRAYDARGEVRKACNLLVSIYETSSSVAWKKWVACNLAWRGANGDTHLLVYIDYLERIADPRQEADILNVLARICAVNFDSDNVMLKRAKEVADQFMAKQIYVPGREKALGIHALLIEEYFANALVYFDSAFNANPRDKVALAGLLAAWIRVNAYDNVVQMIPRLQSLSYLEDPVIVGLVDLARGLQWLSSREEDSPPPVDIAHLEWLKNLKLQKYVGSILDFALGRLYLLEGNAQQAAECFDRFSDILPQNLHWDYYAAWADYLSGNAPALARYFYPYMKSPALWTIACLLLDMNPSFAEKQRIYAYLEEEMKRKSPYVSVIKARLALARGTRPDVIDWQIGSGSLVEDMEALRTVLGYAVATKDKERLAQLIAIPLFHRLPLADQLMWRGLQWIVKGDREQVYAFLEDAAIRLEYRRAALVLITYGVNPQTTRDLLSDLASTRTDTKTELMRLYFIKYEGSMDRWLIENVTPEYKKLANKGEAKAYYALGHLYLCRGTYAQRSEDYAQTRDYYRQSVTFFDNALNMGEKNIPIDCKAFARCARFISTPNTYVDIWSEVKHLSNSSGQSQFLVDNFLVWNAFLEKIWHRNLTDIEIIYRHAAHLIDYWRPLVGLARLAGGEQERIDALVALIQLIARACMEVGNEEQASILINILNHIANHSEKQDLTHFQEIGKAGAVYSIYKRMVKQDGAEALEFVTQQVMIDPSNGLLIFLLAYIYLENDDQMSTIASLRAIYSTANLDERFCVVLADLLENKIISSPMLLEASANTIPEITFSYNIVKAISAFQTGDIAQGCEILLALLDKNAEDIANVVNISRLLPWLCFHAGKERTISASLLKLIYQMIQSVDDEDKKGLVTAAQYLAVLGQVQESYKLWADAVVSDDAMNQLFVKLPRHMAVTAYQAGNIAEAAVNLRTAADFVDESEEGEDFNNKAYKLELQVAVMHLIDHLYPALRNDASKKEGRYHYLKAIIDQHPPLWKILVDADGQKIAIRHEWSAVVKGHQSDIRFLHTLAILHRECALKGLACQHLEEYHMVFSTALWMLLLCSEAFWEYFAEGRNNDEKGDGRTFDIMEQVYLFQETINSLLVLHSRHGRQAFASGRFEDARIHLYCLDLCRGGEKALVTKLREYGLAYDFPLDSAKLDQVITHAEALLEEWSARLVGEAENVTKDAHAIQLLQQGIRKNYQGGIEMLESFIKLNIPVVRVLSTCLNWYNEWFYDLSWANSSYRIYELTEAVDKVAHQLIPRCTKEKVYNPENKVVAAYFSWCGYRGTMHDKQKAIEAYQEALSWNPLDINAKKFLPDLAGEREKDSQNIEDIDNDGEEEEEEETDIYDDEVEDGEELFDDYEQEEYGEEAYDEDYAEYEEDEVYDYE